MSDKFSTEGKSMSEILRMREAIFERSARHFEEFSRAKAEEFARVKEALDPVHDAFMAAKEEGGAIDEAIARAFEGHEHVLFFPAGSTSLADARVAYLDGDGEFVIAALTLADRVEVPAEPAEPAAAEGPEGGALERMVRDATSALAKAGFKLVDAAPVGKAGDCDCPECRRARKLADRLNAEAAVESEPTAVVEDQASS